MILTIRLDVTFVTSLANQVRCNGCFNLNLPNYTVYLSDYNTFGVSRTMERTVNLFKANHKITKSGHLISDNNSAYTDLVQLSYEWVVSPVGL